MAWEVPAGRAAHVVAPLDCAARDDGSAVALNGDVFSGWGFPRREDGVDPPGSPATFEVEGVEGDGFITLKAGQAKPGLSGAPLVNPRTRTVAGLMSATRAATADLGGYVSPVAALQDPAWFEPGPDVPGLDVGAELTALLAANRDLVLGDRSAWLTVLPVPAAGTLADQPWTTFKKTPRSDPSDLLRADYAVVRYLFRDAELDRVRREWCETPDPVGVLAVQGVGGAGKTRFAIELARLMQDCGWVAGWLPATDAAVSAPVPRLLVIDYVEAADPQRLQRVIAGLAASATALAPARLVLLTRLRVGGLSDPLDTIAGQASAVVRCVLAESQDASEATGVLTPAQRGTLFDTAASAFSAVWGEPLLSRRPDLSGLEYQWPVEVCFEALDRVLSGDDSGARLAGKPVERVLEHERRYWAAQLPGVDPELREWAVAAATFAGAATVQEAHEVLGVHPGLAGDEHRHTRDVLAGWWSQVNPGPGVISPLRPDRLGEYHAAQTLDVIAHAGLGVSQLLQQFLALPSDEQVTNVLDLLARAVPGRPGLAAETDEALAGAFPALATRAEGQAKPVDGQGVRRDLGTGLLRLITPAFLTKMSTDTHPARNPGGVSLACATMGDFARDGGMPGPARHLYEAFLAMNERLADSDPGNPSYRRSVAVALQRLADLDAAAGRPDAAREGYAQYLAGMRELAGLDPGNPSYRRDVAVALAKLADLDRDAGRPDAAREGYAQYLAGMRELAGLDPGNPSYRRDVAVALAKLADLDRDAGRPDAAREGYAQYLAGMRELAGLDPGNPSYRRSVAVALQRLADLDRDAGRPEAAREGYAQVLAGMRELAGLDPGNPSYRRSVAVALQRLADLDRDAGRPEAAREGYAQYLAGMRELAGLDPGNPSYRRDVAFGLSKLADLDRDAGRPEAAREGYRQVLALDQELAAANPSAAVHQQDVEIDLRVLAELDQELADGE